MNLFDGQFKSRPKINLSGSSQTKSRDLLIQEAIAERLKRENEKRQHVSATTIQSAFRSYKIRQVRFRSFNLESNNSFLFKKKLKNQALRNDYRRQYEPLFAQASHTDLELKALLSYFVGFHTNRESSSNQDLQSFSQFVLKNKERFITLLVSMSGSNTEYALCRFLALHLELLNPAKSGQNNPGNNISHSVSLRLIDYFTDPKSYANLKYLPGQYEPVLALLLKFLINQGKKYFIIQCGIYHKD